MKMNNTPIITIGREYGSGGREVGEIVAKRLNIACYDKELLRKTANQTGFTEEFIEEYEEKKTTSLLYSLALGGKTADSTHSLPDRLYLEQFKAIREIAEREPCVFIGRCADYALKNNPDAVSVFIMAPIEKRAERIAQRNNVPIEKALLMIRQTDRKRAAYYNYYSDRKWGKANTYRLCIDTSLTGIDGAADIICRYLELKKQRNSDKK